MVLATCQSMLNRSIADSTAARRAAQGLEGESLAVEIDGTGIRVTLRVSQGEITLAADDAGPVSAELGAGPLDLLRLARAGSLGELRGTQARLSGDVSVAEGFAELLRLAKPDFEEALSGWIGDIPAHEVGDATRAFVGWGFAASRALRANMAEYLQEESRVMPGRYEVGAFYGDVERLSDDVDHAAKRLDRLERSLARAAPR